MFLFALLFWNLEHGHFSIVIQFGCNVPKVFNGRDNRQRIPAHLPFPPARMMKIIVQKLL
jgi:hypothetical protein